MSNHLPDEPLYVLICFAVGQAVLIYAACYGLAYACDCLVSSVVRRRQARRTAQPAETP
jgi:hypothetical protein